MAIKKVYDLSVDLKRTRIKANVPVLVQGDTTEFRLRLLDDGKELDTGQISGITGVELLSGFDAQTIVRTTGTMDGSTAVFLIPQGDLFKVGQVKAMVRLTDSSDRISTLHFEYRVISDLTANYVPGEQDVTIFQQYIADAQQKIDEMAATDVQQLSAQLAEKVSIRVFESMPTAAELPEGYLGLILPPPVPFFPFNYLFEGVNGEAWDTNQFSSVEYQGFGTVMDKVASFSEILNNQGHIRVVKSAAEGLASVENKSAFKLDMTGGKKWRIKLDVKRTVINGTNKGNMGISISASDALTSYYPITNALTSGIATYFSNDSVENSVKVRFRKYVSGTQVTDGFVGATGGLGAVSGSRLSLSEGVFHTMELIVSTTNLKLMINGTEYLNLTEDLSVLNSAGCKLVLWGANYDANSLTADHYFDNLLVEEVI